jgi:TonB family protein
MLKHAWSATIWLSLAAFGAGAVLPAAVAAEEAATARKVTKKVMPVVSKIAKQSRITGTVKLVAVVSPEGTVTSVRIVGGNALFVAAAEEAVKQWKFEVAKEETAETLAIKFDNAP